MNINELKATLESIQDQMAALEAQSEKAIDQGDFKSVEIVGDTFEALSDREFDIEQRIKALSAPAFKGCKNTRALISANID